MRVREAGQPMNIVYIHSHDTGRYIEPYGHAVHTPNLSGLAEEGVVFRQAFCAGPTCSPSRAALLTGMAPHSCGMVGLAHLGFRLDDYGRHLVQMLNGWGYETVLSGIQHEADGAEVELIGYSRNLNTLNAESDWEAKDIRAAELAAAFIEETREDKPFFVSVGFFNTHRSKRGFPESSYKVNPNYVLPPFPMYDTADNRADMAEYIASAKVMDQAAGIVLDAIKRSGYADNTVIIYTTDHGLPFPRMKCNLYDSGIGVSLLMKAPGYTKAGSAIDSIVSHIDIVPTLCEMIGKEKPAGVHGASFVSILKGEACSVNDAVFAETNYHVSYEPVRCVRTERYKLIRRFDAEWKKPLLRNVDNSPSKDFIVNAGFAEELFEEEMLFDLYLDPMERVNRANHPGYASIRGELSAKLEAWMALTHDPLLQGEVPFPEGAKVCPKN